MVRQWQSLLPESVAIQAGSSSPRDSGPCSRPDPHTFCTQGVTAWQKRYFVLEGTAVRYYSNFSGASSSSPEEEKGTIELRGARLNDAAPPLLDILDEAGRKWQLKAQTVAECEAWQRALRDAISGPLPAAPSAVPAPPPPAPMEI
eukprot:846829-Prymnesium_polylepis.1